MTNWPTPHLPPVSVYQPSGSYRRCIGSRRVIYGDVLEGVPAGRAGQRSGDDDVKSASPLAKRNHRMSHNAILAVISLLAEKWPSCFSIIESGRRPLKLGIRGDVLAALDGAISAGKVSAALRWYVSSPEYQRRLLHGAWRVDLNGRPAGTVSQEDEAHAPALNLAERMKQTSQAEQLNVPPAARLPPKSTPPPAPTKPLTLKDVRGKRLAEHAEQQPTRKPRGQIRAWRAP